MVAHGWNESLASLSPFTSISARASVDIYESLKAEIISVEQSQTSLQDLVDAAEKIINERFALDPQSIFVWERGSETISVDLAAVMRAMLACAHGCGGEEGKRYIASAVVACSRNGDGVEGLAALGTTWLTHLLFTFKAGRSHESEPNEDSSRWATPTLETTREGVDNSWRSFVNDVMIRDGYQCLLTRFQDESHPAPDKNIPTVVHLNACHILPRAIGQFDTDQTSDSFKSAVTTFDILVNFTRLPVKTLQDLQDHLDDASNGMMLQNDAHVAFDDFYWCLKKREDLQDRLDDPSNGMMLEHHAHDAFDKFYWCLKKTDRANKYTLKLFKNSGNILNKPEGTPFVFRDRSDDFNSGSTRKRKHRPVSLPDPHYIAIHAAIAEILHMSGAGKFFDEILDRYRDEGGEMPPVRCWPELERLMEEEQLRESVIESFQSVRVH